MEEIIMLQELNERLSRNSMGTVYPMPELNEVLKNNTPYEIIRMTRRNFNLSDNYFEFDGYGNLKSYDEIDELLELYHDVE